VLGAGVGATEVLLDLAFSGRFSFNDMTEAQNRELIQYLRTLV
jgi:hypothetical protein